MKKVLQIWAISDYNTGDFLLGPATKQWFEKNIHQADFSNKSCRDNFDEETIGKINSKYDALLVGGGGLILPDTNPNKVSCWQWIISEDNINRINIPIYVVSIGYNLFYNQTIGMPNVDNNHEDKSRLKIFNENISCLIDKSKYFSVRHNGDIELLKQHVPKSLHDKISFQFCPTIEYAKGLSLTTKNSNVLAFEIKEDRTWRRYHKTSKEKFFNDILNFCKQIKNEKEIAVLLHEPNNNKIVEYLRNNGIAVQVIKNFDITEQKIIENFQSIETLYCMAGHSQMISIALGCNTKSIITHNKLKFFLEDIGEYKYENYIDPNSEDVYAKLMDTYNG
jgi:polysaccharide pyruvyl transferase WcaK-like protein